MSVLDSVVERPGVYRWDGADDARLWTEAVERDDVRLVAVGPAASKADLMASFAESLRFPDWFGATYDSLADLLGDDAYDAAGTVILWRDWAALAEADPDAFAIVLEILHDRAGRGHRSVLLHGTGPVVDLPELDA